MPRFLILARDDGSAFATLSPQEAEAVIGRYIAWSAGLRERGSLVLSEKLHDESGRVLARRDGRVAATDGPFAEVKEVVGGFWLLEAPDLDAAAALAADCPHLDFGPLEIREIHELDG
jgi:hypothetical protein